VDAERGIENRRETKTVGGQAGFQPNGRRRRRTENSASTFTGENAFRVARLPGGRFVFTKRHVAHGTTVEPRVADSFVARPADESTDFFGRSGTHFAGRIGPPTDELTTRPCGG